VVLPGGYLTFDSTHTAAGTYATDTWSLSDPNYASQSGTITDVINKAPSTTVVTFEVGPYTYRGTPFTATATVTGVGGLSQAVTVNYNRRLHQRHLSQRLHRDRQLRWRRQPRPEQRHKSITINKAPSTTVVTFEVGPYTYRGTPFTATATVTGVGGLSQAVTVNYTGDCTNVTSANGLHRDRQLRCDANHDPSSGTKSITINKAPSTTVVTFEVGPYTYRGTPFTATATVTELVASARRSPSTTPATAPTSPQPTVAPRPPTSVATPTTTRAAAPRASRSPRPPRSAPSTPTT